jgi:hypothetical protein
MEDTGRHSGGLLKVVVAYSRNLAVQDITSSDSYAVILCSLVAGTQTDADLARGGHRC